MPSTGVRGPLAAVRSKPQSRLGSASRTGPAKGGEWDDGKSHDAAENCERAETRRRNEESGADAATRGGQRNYEVDGALSTSAKGERHRIGDHRAAADQSEVPPETQQDERQTKNDHRGRRRRRGQEPRDQQRDR